MPTQQVTHNGRSYTVAYCGPTKFGRRAKLVPTEGGAEVWVDAAVVEGGAAGGPPAADAPRRCRKCRQTSTELRKYGYPSKIGRDGYCSDCRSDD